MGVYIKGIEMPKEPDEMIELVIFGDGKTLKTGESWRSPVDRKCYYGTSEDMNTYSALTVPPHGRLIDADALIEKYGEWYTEEGAEEGFIGTIKMLFSMVPTIIEAEDGE